jgi:hypothetical protein
MFSYAIAHIPSKLSHVQYLMLYKQPNPTGTEVEPLPIESLSGMCRNGSTQGAVVEVAIG